MACSAVRVKWNISGLLNKIRCTNSFYDLKIFRNSVIAQTAVTAVMFFLDVFTELTMKELEVCKSPYNDDQEMQQGKNSVVENDGWGHCWTIESLRNFFLEKRWKGAVSAVIWTNNISLNTTTSTWITGCH